MTQSETPNGVAQADELNGHAGVSKPDFDCIVIGAGFGGLRMLYELRKKGFTGRVFEAGTGVGGTWYWNRYPGARTDSESWVYIFTFLEQIGMEWSWKERYPSQIEVEQYLNKMTDFLNLRKDISFESRIDSATWDSAKKQWTITTAQGNKFTSTFLVTATGPLATPIKPPFPGLDSFKGEWYQTGLWPKHKVDFAGKRVALIGTGATGVQVAPVVAHAAKNLTIFQRTPNFVMPGRNHTLMLEQMDEIKRDYETVFARARGQNYGFDMVDSSRTYDQMKNEAEVQRVLESGWEKGGFRYVFETFGDLLLNPKTNEAASEFVRNKIRAIVDDQETAETLCPYYPIVSKRPPVGHHYYETFNRKNVKLVDIRNNPILEFTEKGLKTTAEEYEFDLVIFAIGFDAVTGTLSAIDIRGEGDKTLKDTLKQDLATTLGITLPDFPNMFMIFGPQAPFANGPLVIDNTADWIGQTMLYMKQNGYDRVESTLEAAQKWSDLVDLIFNSTVIAQSAKDVGAWLVGANVENKQKRTLFFFGGVPAYIAAVEKERTDGYPSHVFSNTVEAY